MVQIDSNHLNADGKLEPALSDDEAMAVVKGIVWKNKEDNYGHFGLLEGDDAKKYPTIEETIKDLAGILTKAKVLNKKVKAIDRFDKRIFGDLKADKSLGDVWSRLKLVEGEKVDPITFSAANADIKEFQEPTLKELTEKLKLKQAYYVDIKGVIKGDTPEDDT